MRAGVDILEGGRELGLNGVGGMEVCEGRGFVCGVIDGLRCVARFCAAIWLLPFRSIYGVVLGEERDRCMYANEVRVCRKIGASKETSRREREAEERESGLGPDGDEDDDDDDGMDI